jgi:hypothetical protein
MKMAGDLNTHVDEDQLKDKVARQPRLVAADRTGSVTLHVITGRSGHIAPADHRRHDRDRRRPHCRPAGAPVADGSLLSLR